MTPERSAAPELAGAWTEKVRRIDAEWAHVASAPALFKPDHIRQLLVDRQRAVAWVAYWRWQS